LKQEKVYAKTLLFLTPLAVAGSRLCRDDVTHYITTHANIGQGPQRKHGGGDLQNSLRYVLRLA